MFDNLEQWSENWAWIDDLLYIPEPPPFAEYNTDESLAIMEGNPLPWIHVNLED